MKGLKKIQLFYKKWYIKNSETSETSETTEFFDRVFDFEYWVKITKSEEKKSEKNFRGFRVFDPTTVLHIFLFKFLKA